MKELTIRLESGSAVPLYEQIYRFIAEEIGAGRLKTGERLPSKRALSQHLKVSQSTVETAYGLLTAEGFLEARDRSGFFVLPIQALQSPRPAPPRGKAAEMAPTAPPRFDFSTSSVDTDIFPYKTWVKLFRETLYAHPDLLRRGEARGEIALRQALSAFLYQYRNVRCEPEQLIIGPGVDSLLADLFTLLPADTVIAAEDPGYQGIHRIGQRHHLPIVPVQADEQGMQVEALRQSGAQLAYVTPSHQFPLGITMPVGRRSALLAWAGEQPGRYLIEDDYDSEFRHDTRPIPAMQGLPGGDRVIYVGTFSRSLAPSLRIAYMALPAELLPRYQQAFAHGGNTVSRFEQRTLARFIQDGHFARHLRRAGNVYTKRCQALGEALRTIPGASIRGHEAGLHFMLTVPHLPEKVLLDKAALAGIRLRGLSEYCQLAHPLPSTLVLGYAGLKDEQIGPAVDILRRAWQG